MCFGIASCSFAAGTMVSTPNGLEAIESLKPGDQILSQDKNSGELTYKTISDAYGHVHDNGMTLPLPAAQASRKCLPPPPSTPSMLRAKALFPQAN
jgi:hypothetical protein